MECETGFAARPDEDGMLRPLDVGDLRAFAPEPHLRCVRRYGHGGMCVAPDGRMWYDRRVHRAEIFP